MAPLTGKRCLITGASSGIGLAIAQCLAQDGARLALVSRSKERLAAAVATLPPAAPPPLTLAGDVTRAADVDRVVAKALEAWGGIDVLVNAAGAAVFLPVGEMAEAQWDQVLDANLKAVFLMCRRLVPPMLAAGSGDIVNIGSVAAHQGFENSTAYCASKHGLLGFSRALALEVRKKGLRVITVSPGSVNTPLWDTTGWSPDRSKMLQAGDVAEAVAAALSLPGRATVDELIVMPKDGVL